MMNELSEVSAGQLGSGLESIKDSISVSYNKLNDLLGRLRSINARLNGESSEKSKENKVSAPSRAGVNGEILDLNDIVGQTINGIQEEIETIERFI